MKYRAMENEIFSRQSDWDRAKREAQGRKRKETHHELGPCMSGCNKYHKCENNNLACLVYLDYLGSGRLSGPKMKWRDPGWRRSPARSGYIIASEEMNDWPLSAKRWMARQRRLVKCSA